VAAHRRELLADVHGRVIELGAGNGLNFPADPDTVTEVVAVEPEDYLRERAHKAAAAAPVTVTVVDAVADRLPFPDEQFDAAVASLALCSVPDQAAALAELPRLVRPGGELRARAPEQPAHRRDLAARRRLEHLPADRRRVPRRPPAAAIRAAGFEIESCRHFPFKGGPVSALHILGAARRL
jgi:ubiquinone/menaquinone biosynthesis C-methylase UbiE